jgi:hypothetical protein
MSLDLLFGDSNRPPPQRTEPLSPGQRSNSAHVVQSPTAASSRVPGALFKPGEGSVSPKKPVAVRPKKDALPNLEPRKK